MVQSFPSFDGDGLGQLQEGEGIVTDCVVRLEEQEKRHAAAKKAGDLDDIHEVQREIKRLWARQQSYESRRSRPSGRPSHNSNRRAKKSGGALCRCRTTRRASD